MNKYRGKLIVLKNTVVNIYKTYKSLNGGTFLVPPMNDPKLPAELVSWFTENENQILRITQEVPKLSAVKIKWEETDMLEVGELLEQLQQFAMDETVVGKPFRIQCAVREPVNPQDLWYKGVPDGSSKKKVEFDEARGDYFETKDPSKRYATFVLCWKVILRVQTSDSYDDVAQLKIFGDTANNMWGKTATEMNDMLEEDCLAYGEFVGTIKKKTFEFGVRAVKESFGGINDLAFYVDLVEPV